MIEDKETGRNLCWARVALFLMVAVYIGFFSAMTLRQHESLRTHVFDLGNVDQAIWNTVHGRPLHFTTQPAVGEHRMGMHVEPLLFLLALLYHVYPDPRGLLVLQTIGLGLAAIPLYALARRRLRSHWLALAFPLAYLMLPALQAVNLFEFHAVAFAPFFLLSAFYYLDRATWPESRPLSVRKPDVWAWVLFGVFVLLALSCKEDIALIIVLLGLYIVFVRKRRTIGVLTALTGTAWFYVAVYVVIPHFRPAGSPFLGFYEELGDNPFSIAWTLVSDPGLAWKYLVTPENGLVLVALGVPLAGLPLFGFPFWLMATPSLAVSFLSSNPLMHRMERYHYAAPMIPVVLAASVFGVHWLSHVLAGRKRSQRRAWVLVFAVIMVGASLWYHYHRGFTPLARAFSWPEVTAHHRMIGEVVEAIPREAVVSAQANLFPHISQRERAYLWPDPRPKDYVLLDVSAPSFWNGDAAHENLKRMIQEDDEFGWVLARDGYLVLKKGAEKRELPDEFYTFVREKSPRIAYPMTVDFDDAVRFLGFSPLYDREEEVRFILYFRALRPLEDDYRLALYLVDAEGNVVGGTEHQQPALVWYPTSRWKTNETIRVVANTLNWWTGDLEEYAVALGVSAGDDIWDVGARLRPKVRDSIWLTPVLGEETLLQLMRFRRGWQLHYPVEAKRRFEAPAGLRSVEARFDNRVELVGYRLQRDELSAGEVLEVNLTWKALVPLEKSYKVFVHVSDRAGKVVAQCDSTPGGGTFPTTGWVAGEYITDRYVVQLDEGLPAGRYDVVTGLYHPDSGMRLPVQGDSELTRGDHIVLDQAIEIVR